MFLLVFGSVACTTQNTATIQSHVGEKISAVYQLGHSQIPLTAGDWVVLGRQYEEGKWTYYRTHDKKYLQGADPYLIVILGLVDESHNELKEIIFAEVNAQARAGGWSLRECTFSNTFLYQSIIKAEESGPQNCWLISHQKMSFSGDFAKKQMIQEARQYLRKRNIRVPINMVYSHFRLASHQNYVSIRHLFNPDLEGIKQTASGEWHSSDWHQDHISKHPDKLTYIEKLKHWSEQWRHRVERGFEAN